MHHLNRHHHARKRPVFYVPASFHPEDMLPPQLLLHAQSAYYLLHLLLLRFAHGEHDWARLKMKYLENVLVRRHCNPTRTALEEHGDIRRVGGYRVGQHAIGYLLGKQYKCQRLRAFHPTNPQLLHSLARVQHETEESGGRNRLPIHEAWEEWQNSLTLDIDQARSAVARLPVLSNPYDTQSLLIDRLRREEYRLTVNDFGRVHNSITNLYRTIRPALRTHGKPTMHIDIVNSQPALLAMLLRRPSNVESGDFCLCQRDPARAARHRPPDSHHLDATTTNAVSIDDRTPFIRIEGGDHYQKLANGGRLYEHLMARTGMSRAEVKVGLLRDVFGKRGHYPCPLEQAFREDFPGVYQVIRWLNRDNHAALLRDLQRVESDLVIHRVGRRLQELRCTGCISLHDAVFVLGTCPPRGAGISRRDEGHGCANEAGGRGVDLRGDQLPFSR
ncbi:MAG: hypothetical protein ACYC0X_31595 [Pirellulaceae bacterium]